MITVEEEVFRIIEEDLKKKSFDKTKYEKGKKKKKRRREKVLLPPKNPGIFQDSQALMLSTDFLYKT